MVLIKSRPDYEGAEKHGLYLLENRLPPNAPYYKGGELYFHGIKHTTDDVVPGIESLLDEHKRLGREEIGDEEQRILRLAATWHDTGFIERYEENERIAAKMVREFLPEYGFSPGKVEVTEGIIMATQMPQEPHEGNILQYMMCDSDLGNFGRTDVNSGFFPMTHRLWREIMAVKGVKISLVNWYEGGLSLLKGHEYFSDAGKSLGDEGKARNLEELKRRLGELYSNPKNHDGLEMQFLKSEIID